MCEHIVSQLRVNAALRDKMVHGVTPPLPPSTEELVKDFATAVYLMTVLVSTLADACRVTELQILDTMLPQEGDSCGS